MSTRDLCTKLQAVVMTEISRDVRYASRGLVFRVLRFCRAT